MRPSSGVPDFGVGPYVVERQLGGGAAGIVHLARDERLQRRVALTLVPLTPDNADRVAAEMTRRARLLGRLDSPHVEAVFDHGVRDGVGYLVTQYAAGGDLHGLLQARGALPPGVAVQVCEQVADALVVAHAAGIVHGRLSAREILLRDERGERLHVIVHGFDTAPEEGPPADTGADLRAVGLLLHACLTGTEIGTQIGTQVGTGSGELPGAPRWGRPDEIGRALDDVIARCVAAEHPARFRDAAGLRLALREVAARFTAPPPPPILPPVVPPGPAPGSAGGPSGGTATARTRRRVVLVAGTTGALVVAGIGVGLLLHGRGGADDPPPGNGGPTAAPTATPTSGPVAGDVTGDGLGDVLLLGTDNQLLLYRGRGDGGFAAPATLARGISTAQVTRLDTDPSGTSGAETPTQDVVGLEDDYLGTVTTRVLVGPPAPPQELAMVPEVDADRASPAELALGDVTGDGRADLVSTADTDDRTRVLVAPGDGAGGFGAPVVFADVPRIGEPDTSTDTLVGDVDGDGVADVVRIAGYGDAQRPSAVVLLSTGGALAEPGPARVLSDTFAPALTLADLDGDGREELVVAAPYDGTIAVARFGADRFTPVQLAYDAPVPHPLTTPAASDLDGDGDDELVVVQERRLTALTFGGGRLTPLRSAPGRRVDQPDVGVVGSAGDDTDHIFF